MGLSMGYQLKLEKEVKIVEFASKKIKSFKKRDKEVERKSSQAEVQQTAVKTSYHKCTNQIQFFSKSILWL